MTGHAGLGWLRSRYVQAAGAFAVFCLVLFAIGPDLGYPLRSVGIGSGVGSELVDTSPVPSPFDGQNGTFRYIPAKANGVVTGKRARYAKVSLISGFEDVVYERALETHIRHARRHGYPVYVARQEAAPGMFNKVAFVLNVLMTELYKPAEERVEWLFYFDADTILMNEEMPLEMFDTPSDFSKINWIAAKDWNGLNAGVFILRVNKWSVDLLTRVMTHKHYHPDEDYTFEEQSILARLTEKDDRFRHESVYVPKTWINSYFYLNREVIPGSLIAHFPHPDYKWHMYTWLKATNDDLALLAGPGGKQAEAVYVPVVAGDVDLATARLRTETASVSLSSSPSPPPPPPASSSPSAVQSDPPHASSTQGDAGTATSPSGSPAQKVARATHAPPNPPPVSKDGKPIYNVPVDKTNLPAEVKSFWAAKRRFDRVLAGFARNINRNANPVTFGLQHDETKELATKFRDLHSRLQNEGPGLTDRPKELTKLLDEAENASAALISALMAYFETHDDPPSAAGFR